MDKVDMGEPLYEYTLRITGITEYGVSFGELISGKVAPPPEGVRFDVAFEGIAIGSKLSGKVTGVDYLWIRADGRMELNIHAVIAIENGQNISLYANGVGISRKDSSITDLRENVTLFSSSNDYKWVNSLQLWGVGTVDLATQTIKVAGYAV